MPSRVLVPLCLLGYASAEKADVTFGIDHEFIQMATDYIGPAIIDSINQIQAEDVYFDDNQGFFKNIHINFQKGDKKDLAVNFKPDNQSISLVLENVLGQITADWQMCGVAPICLWGSTRINLRNDGFQLHGDLDLGSTTSSHTGKMIPKMTIENFETKLKAEDLQFNTYNSLNADAIDLAIYFAEETMLPVVMDAISKGVPQMWNQVFSDLMDKYGGVINLGSPDLNLDLSYSASPLVTPEHLQIFLNANLIDSKGNKIAKNEKAADMKIDAMSSQSLQFGLSQEPLNSGALAMFQAGLIQFDIPASTAPSVFSTDGFKGFIPEFEKHYGKGVPIDVHVAAYQAPEITFKKAGFVNDQSFGGQLWADLTFMVKGEEALKIRMDNADFVASFFIKDWKLTFQLDNISIDTTSLISSKIGDVNVRSLADTFDLLMDAAVPAIDAMIPEIDIPRALDKDIQMKELDLEFHDGYMYFEIGFEQAQAFLAAL